ncbi:MAG: ArdC family protein [Promethearchaeota archaeon]
MRKIEKINFKQFEKITKMMIKGITETEQLPWQQSWIDNSAPTNWTTKKKYSGINCMILSFVRQMFNYTTPYWAGYKQMNKLGGRIEKGAKGVPILVPKYSKYYLKHQNSMQDQNSEKKEEVNLISDFVVKHVFNLDQCAIPERYNPRFPKRKKFDPIKKAEEIIFGYRKSPLIHQSFDGAYYVPSRDELFIPPKENFNQPEEYYNTLFHEMIHSTGHQSRLKRFSNKKSISDKDFRKKYSQEELVAEFGASFLSSEAHILKNVQQNSVAYLQGWVSYLKDHDEELLSAAILGARAANYILNKYSNHELRCRHVD